MIQELLGGLVEERKISIPNGLLLLDGSSSASSLSSPTTISSSSASPASSAQPEPQQNLRCPRCDSSNTKFCYYNNYNLTQPRHFCKTCRRYWTKGGALRNVPIGGGCRKAKPATIAAAVAGSGIGKPSSGCGKAKPAALPDLPAMFGKPGLGGGALDHELSSSPVLWGSPHTSHLLALLRGSGGIPNTNPMTSLNAVRVSEDGAMMGSHIAGEPTATINAQSLSLDPFGQLTMGPLWRNGSQCLYNHQQQQQQPQQLSMLLGETPGSGIQELYQRLRSSAGYYTDPLSVVSANLVPSSSTSSSSTSAAALMATSSATSAIMEPIALGGGEFGYWNPALSWGDLPASNGPFP